MYMIKSYAVYFSRIVCMILYNYGYYYYYMSLFQISFWVLTMHIFFMRFSKLKNEVAIG